MCLSSGGTITVAIRTLYDERTHTMQMNENDLQRMNKVVRHRLRNSASGLKASVTFLSKELADRLSPQEQEYFPLILNECDAITDLTNRLQQLFDPISETPPIKIGDALNQAVEKLRKRFPTAAIDIQCEPTMLDQTIPSQQTILIPLEELLTNAIEAAPRETTVLHMETDENTLVISITDQGPGFGDHQKEALQPFFTTKTRHLGTGLTIAQRLLQHVEGSLTLSSSETGSTVVLRYPLPSPHIP